MDDARYRREAAFHDAVFAEQGRQRADKFYEITHSSSKAFYRQYLAAHCEGKRVLEYGCGADSHGAFLAARGSRVTSIDLSPVAVSINRNRARSEGGAIPEFCVMNAESLALADNTLDLICGNGILHHLSLDSAYRELARVLKPEGSAIFLEPLGHNPLINLYRKLTPSLRTPDEHPLLATDLARAQDHFSSAGITYFHLTTLAAVPLAGKPGYSAILGALERLDKTLFRNLPGLRKHAWAAAIVLLHPCKRQTAPGCQGV
jgi:SAM-dependent methyltransferase